MKSYTITVNGTAYDVTVEEGQSSLVQVETMSPARPVMPHPKTQQQTSLKQSIEKPISNETVVSTKSQAAGSVRVEAGAAGKIFKIEASVGQVVKRGDTLVILEAMKMEIPVVAAGDGTVASINVVVGDAVEAGALLATLN
jgi:glutaconyl-CoA/methylmalonyl-CoA decarboxylase subunit gamma